MADSPLKLHGASPAELKARIEAEREGRPFLLYRDDGGAQQIRALEESGPPITIGRWPSSDVCLVWDEQVSRLHAQIECVGEDWTLVDEGVSRNGSFVNGERISGRRRLDDGDTLRFGETVIAYRDPRPGKPAATVTAGERLTVADLSETQLRVLVALCRPIQRSGAFSAPATNKAIAQEVFLSVEAVKTHLRALFAKFGVENLPQNQKRLALVEGALQSGLISEHGFSRAPSRSIDPHS
jgi:pSer/pThr/pTyr-binding forkhead associated (FHA) protein